MTQRYIHRGTTRGLPGNSAEGLREALLLEFDGVEIDVQMSADNVLYAAHDAYVTLNGERRYFRNVLSTEIDGLPNAIRPAALHELLDIIADTDMGVLLDLKAAGSGAALAPLLAEHGLTKRTKVISFRHPEITTLRFLIPDVEVGIIVGFTREMPDFRGLVASAAGLLCPIRTAVRLKTTIVAVPTWRITRRTTRSARERGIALYAWSSKPLLTTPARFDVDAVILDVAPM